MKKHKHSKHCGCRKPISQMNVMEICRLIMDCGELEKAEKAREVELADEMLEDSKFDITLALTNKTETP